TNPSEVRVLTVTSHALSFHAFDRLLFAESPDVLIKVDPSKPASLTWQRKVNSEGNVPSEFSLGAKDIIQLVCSIGFRLWRHVREEAAKGRNKSLCLFLYTGGIYSPFEKRNVTSCHGVPLGGMG
ncbi:hypothetical protein C3L33_21280, partial [Rhododendron williamsianum]